MTASEAFDTDVLILGGSLLGVELVHQLLRRSGRAMPRFTVVDRLAKHDYIPLCHERLTARLTIEESTLDTQAYVTSHGGEYVVGEIVALDPETHAVTLASGRTLRGRTVVVALGSDVAPPPPIHGAGASVTEHLAGLKFARELAPVQAALDRRRGRPTRIAVVGGGISGCELAGELAVWAERETGVSVTLVQRGERLLEGLTPFVSRAALRVLKRQRVDVRLGASMKIDADGTARIHGQHETAEPAFDLVIWSVGLTPPPIARTLGLSTDARGWLRVSPTLECLRDDAPSARTHGALTHEGVFAGGDIVQIYEGSTPIRAMRRAIEAIVQAGAIAKNVLAILGAKDDTSRRTALRVYRPLRDFPHGVSLGARSLLVLGPICFDLFAFTVWFRRFLMWRYLARYAPKR
jgi:NADH dehydrogenase